MAMNAGELAAQLADEPISPFGAAGTTLLRHEPLGVVSILTPWNFPHSLNVMKVSRALAAGNTMVLKPSPLTPLAGLALARIIDEHTDIPPGVVNVVTPSGIEASKVLTTDPRIDMVSFTGSSAVGREVMAAAGGTMKRILLECGGKSAGIVLDDVEVTDELLERFLFDGCSLHAGQACILQSRLLLPERLHDEVVDRLVELARRVKVGDPTDPEVQMGPLISSAQLDRVEAHVSAALDGGATLAAGGRRPPGLDKGFYFEPTILTDVDPGLGDRPGRSVRTGVGGAALPRRRRRGRDRQQLAVRALRRGLGQRRGPRGRRCAPRPHRTDRRKRLHPRRCAVRRIQTERAGPRRRRTSRAVQLHGAEGHRNPGVMAALEGLRVVEIAGDIAGPYCTKLLVDLGAEVTKIEPPTGDPLRRWGPFPGGIPIRTSRDCSSISMPGSTAPQSISTAMHAAARRLIAQAHLLVDGLRPGTLDQRGPRQGLAGVAQPRSRRRPHLGLRPALGRFVTAMPRR